MLTRRHTATDHGKAHITTGSPEGARPHQVPLPSCTVKHRSLCYNRIVSWTSYHVCPCTHHLSMRTSTTGYTTTANRQQPVESPHVRKLSAKHQHLTIKATPQWSKRPHDATGRRLVEGKAMAGDIRAQLADLPDPKRC